MNDELADPFRKLDEEKETPRLTEELTRGELPGALAAENKKLKEELQAAKDRYKKMWRMTCEQSREQEELLAAQKEEIDRLKLHARGSRIHSPTPAPSPEHSPSPSEFHSAERVPIAHLPRGKAPPIGPSTGEDPEIRLDD